ncbi:MAG: hypothetical protein AAGF15_06420 [Pseudomonadota bacterium]
MDTILDTLVVEVRADTRPFDQAMARVRQQLADLNARHAAATLTLGSFSGSNLRPAGGGVLGALGQLISGSGILGGGRQKSFPGLLGLFSNGAGFRETGGSVNSGRPFIVGERGPELFFPGQHGRVEPIARGNREGSGGVSITVNVNATGSASRAEGLEKSATQIAGAVRRSFAQHSRRL